MKLIELNNVIDFSFDFTDNELDASFYCEIEEIAEEFAKQIEVKKIMQNYIVCDFKSFILRHKTKVKAYLKSNYTSDYWHIYFKGIFENTNKYEAEEWIASFIEQDLASFLIADIEE